VGSKPGEALDLPAQSAMQVLGHKRTKSTSELSRLGVSGNTNQLGNYWPPKFLATSTLSVLPARTDFFAGCARRQVGTKPFRRTDEAILKRARATTPTCSVTQAVKMIEVVTAILGLFCAGIFVAHAVDAYLAL
jgi:hypothetical protein